MPYTVRLKNPTEGKKQTGRNKENATERKKQAKRNREEETENHLERIG